MRRLHAQIPGSIYREIDSPLGHDGFLVEYEQLNALLLPFEAEGSEPLPEEAVGAEKTVGAKPVNPSEEQTTNA